MAYPMAVYREPFSAFAVTPGTSYYTIDENGLSAITCVDRRVEAVAYSGEKIKVQRITFESACGDRFGVSLAYGRNENLKFPYMGRVYYRKKSDAIFDGLHKLRMQKNAIQAGIDSKSISVKEQTERRFQQRIWGEIRDASRRIELIDEKIAELTRQELEA